MMNGKLTEDQVLQRFRGNMHCSQVVLMEVAEDLGYDREEAGRIATPFAGGMLRGDTCGAVTGALIAIGMRFGNGELGNKKQDRICQKKLTEFQERFTARFGSTICRDLLGYDFSQPGQTKAAFADGRVYAVCPGFVIGALEILQELLEVPEDE